MKKKSWTVKGPLLLDLSEEREQNITLNALLMDVLVFFKSYGSTKKMFVKYCLF
jgi:hypothetical protein